MKVYHKEKKCFKPVPEQHRTNGAKEITFPFFNKPGEHKKSSRKI